MLKLGVYSVEKLRAGKTRTLLGRRKRISLQLLSEIEQFEEYDQLFEAVICDLADDRGAYKRSSPARFTEFDRKAAGLLRETLGDDVARVSIHDVAVSNARTAVDFYRLVADKFGDIRYMATDYDPALTIIDAGNMLVVLSSRNVVMQIVWPPFVFTPNRPEHPVMYPVNRLLCKFLQVTSVERLVNRFACGELEQSRITTIDLFCQAARNLANSDQGFDLGTYDLLEPAEVAGRYDCIRAMNVLNSNYFDNEQLSTVLDNIAASLVEGGVLIAGSNQEAGSQVHGGVYRLSGSRFEPILQVGNNEFLTEQLERFNSGSFRS